MRFITAVILAITTLLLPATALAKDKPEEHKVWVCHATAGLGELKNGYDLINVDINATNGPDHLAHATTDPKNNSHFGVLYDYIDVDPDNLPGKCGETPPTTTEEPPSTTEPPTSTEPPTTTVPVTEPPTTTPDTTSTTPTPITSLAPPTSVSPPVTEPTAPETTSPSSTQPSTTTSGTQPGTPPTVDVGTPPVPETKKALPVTGNGDRAVTLLLALAAVGGGALAIYLARRPEEEDVE